MAWSRSQQIALAVVPKISSIFSLCGSSWIIIEVANNATKRRHPYHRMLLSMSIYDVLESIGNFMSTWPIPASSGGKVWNVGTEFTCSLQGFFLTFSVAVPMYNAFLALYYMLVVNHNFTDRTLRRVVEPAIHGITFTWAFGTALSSAVLGLLNDANLWCWIAPLPSDCKDSWRFGDDEANCVRGDNAWIYRWAFYFAPLWFCIFVATICTLLVYFRVKHLDERTLRYRRPMSIMDVRQREGSRRFFVNKKDHSPPPLPREEEQEGEFFSENRQSLPRKSSRCINAGLLSVSSNHLSIGDRDSDSVLDLSAEEQKDDDFLSGSLVVVQHWAEAGVVGRWALRRKIYREDYRRSVEVAQQAVWYLTGFYLTHVWSTSNRIVQQLHQGSTWYTLILMHAWFDPFQGFLNYVVYQRPRYLKIRRADPSLSRLTVIWRALRFSFLTPVDTVIKKPEQNAPTQANSPMGQPASMLRPAPIPEETRDSKASTGPMDDYDDDHEEENHNDEIILRKIEEFEEIRLEL